LPFLLFLQIFLVVLCSFLEPPLSYLIYFLPFPHQCGVSLQIGSFSVFTLQPSHSTRSPPRCTMPPYSPRALCFLLLTVSPSPIIAHRSAPGSGRWTKEEHEGFLVGLRTCGRDWTAIAAHWVSTRSVTQVRTHAQKYYLKIDRGHSFPQEVRR